MNGMKKILSLIFISTLLFMLPSASAHPGRTDSRGGHTDKSTGEYHYHHGYPEHQHYNMDGDGKIDCPYDFKDKTGSSSGTSSGSTKKPTTPPTTPTVPRPEPTTSPITPTTAPTNPKPAYGFTPLSYTQQAEASYPLLSPSLLILAALFIPFHLYIHSSRKRTLQEMSNRLENALQAYNYQRELSNQLSKNEKDYQDSLAESHRQLLLAKSALEAIHEEYAKYSSQANKALIDRINQLTAAQELSDRKHEEFLTALKQAYGNDFLLHASGAPPEIFYDAYGLPRCSDSVSSDPYMLHRSSTGMFHSSRCSHSRNCIPIHALNVSPEEFTRNRCQVCKPEYPDFSWIEKYHHLIEISK